MKTIPFPETFWTIRPSPPNSADDSFFWNAISRVTFSSEARYPVFWTNHPPLEMSMSMIFPGAFWDSPTTPLPPWASYFTRNSEAPVMERFMLPHTPSLAFASRVMLPVM